MYTHRQGKIGYLVGDTTALNEDPTYAIWDTKNSMTMTWLVNSMEEEIKSSYMCYAMTKEL